MEKINTRPREKLKFSTPKECFIQKINYICTCLLNSPYTLLITLKKIMSEKNYILSIYKNITYEDVLSYKRYQKLYFLKGYSPEEIAKHLYNKKTYRRINGRP